MSITSFFSREEPGQKRPLSTPASSNRMTKRQRSFFPGPSSTSSSTSSPLLEQEVPQSPAEAAIVASLPPPKPYDSTSGLSEEQHYAIESKRLGALKKRAVKSALASAFFLHMDLGLEPGWRSVLSRQFSKPYFAALANKLHAAASSSRVYPPPADVFNAFALTPFSDVRVVILGQDPYHGPGQAHGLCFSVKHGVKPPPSLRNIFKELSSQTGFVAPDHGNLEAWAAQGVLLLNTSLTVRAGDAGSHSKWGWAQFTDAVIDALNKRKSGLIFLLWGSHAKSKTSLLSKNKHHILTSAHPSPLAAYRGFFGNGHFTKTNAILAKKGLPEINWQLPNRDGSIPSSPSQQPLSRQPTLPLPSSGTVPIAPAPRNLSQSRTVSDFPDPQRIGHAPIPSPVLLKDATAIATTATTTTATTTTATTTTTKTTTATTPAKKLLPSPPVCPPSSLTSS